MPDELHNLVWFEPQQISGFEGIHERSVLRKYSRFTGSLNGRRGNYVRQVPSERGGGRDGMRLQFAYLQIAEDFPGIVPPAAKQLAEKFVTTSEAPPALPEAKPEIVRQSALAFIPKDVEKALSLIPERAQPLARARWQCIELIETGKWKERIGSTLHGIRIEKLTDFIQALAADFTSGANLLRDWPSITPHLRQRERGVAHSDRKTSALVSVRTLWRWHGWYASGRETPQSKLPPGPLALQEPEWRHKGTTTICKPHQDFIIAAYQGGDESVTRAEEAQERGRTLGECRDLLKIEIALGRLPGPLPSYSAMYRFINSTVPQSLNDIANLGPKRAFRRHGAHIMRDRSSTEVNDQWYCDFRRVNVRAWFYRERPLYRIWLCAIMDVASRDLCFVFGPNPSSALFKSTFRSAAQRWGIPREIWFDNGKEFTTRELTGGWMERDRRFKFDVTGDVSLGLFAHLEIATHFCIEENPNGKAELERSFQFFDRVEAKLKGSTGNDKNIPRPQRLKREERMHRDFQDEVRPDTPLLHVEQPTEFEGHRREGLKNFLSRMFEAQYRHRGHSSLLGRTPAQVQAAYRGTRRIPDPQELDVLLWNGGVRVVHGDRIAINAWGRTFQFRHERLLTLPIGAEVEVHVDPSNLDRAVALLPGGAVVLEPVKPTGGEAGADLQDEMKRQRALRREMKRASFASSRMARVLSPDNELAARESISTQAALDAHRADRREPLELPAAAAAVEALAKDVPPAAEAEDVALPKYADAEIAAIESEVEPVFTSRTEAEEWRSQKKRASR